MNQLKQELSKAKTSSYCEQEKKRGQEHIESCHSNSNDSTNKPKVEKEEMRQKRHRTAEENRTIVSKLEEVGWNTDNHALQELQKRN